MDSRRVNIERLIVMLLIVLCTLCIQRFLLHCLRHSHFAWGTESKQQINFEQDVLYVGGFRPYRPIQSTYIDVSTEPFIPENLLLTSSFDLTQCDTAHTVKSTWLPAHLQVVSLWVACSCTLRCVMFDLWLSLLLRGVYPPFFIVDPLPVFHDEWWNACTDLHDCVSVLLFSEPWMLHSCT